MKLISHRGLINGPNKLIENHPDRILKTLSLGFDCEIDLWVVNSKLFLGHDEPQYLIDKNYLENSRQSFWIHAKNIEAMLWLNDTNFIYFWHQNDDVTLTSNNFIWTYPGKQLTIKSICVLPELYSQNFKEISELSCYGICSDYVENIYDQLPKSGMYP